jgi:alkylhydroperoxidase family enzyme
VTEGPVGFVAEPRPSDAAAALFDADVQDRGYVMNLTRAWAHTPDLKVALMDLTNRCAEVAGLDVRQRGVLITAMASTLGDAYCSLAWGTRLADATDEEVAASVVRGDDHGLDDAGRALASWARRLVDDPNGTTADDVDALRRAGFTDEQIVALTTFVALRLAFSTVNDALGVRPDAQLAEQGPAALIEAITFGRSVPQR